MTSDTVTVGIGLSVYQDYPSVKRLISSVHTKVDRIFAIDGRYLSFDSCSAAGLSNDGTREYLQEFDNVLLIDLPNCSQVAKRDQYLREAEKYKIDIIIVLDADEYIEERDGGFEDFRKRASKVLQNENDGLGSIHNLYGLWERYGAPDQLQHNPRVILRPEQCEYFNRHNWVRNKSRGYRLWMEPPFSKGIVLRGDNDLRTERRERLMDTYEAFQSVCEEKYT